MSVLIKGAKVVIPTSEFNGKIIDVFVKDGLIQKIGNVLDEKADQVIEFDGAVLSLGWHDVRSWLPVPGNEHKETIESFTKAANRGGFTSVSILPNTEPTIQNKGQLKYITESFKNASLEIHPYGALTEENKGLALGEMLEMSDHGAIAFTDGLEPIWHSGILLKGLQYAEQANKIIIDQPIDKKLSDGGIMHEGIVSTRLGLKGIPALAEHLAIQKAIEILRYAGGKLHFSTISTAKSVELIKQAKQEGLNVTCDVALHNLVFTDEIMEGFESVYKVIPPYRSQSDKDALIQGVLDGVIDTISSNHIPHEDDAKVCELDYSEFGNTALETFASVFYTYLADKISEERFFAIMSKGSRGIFELAMPKFEEGSTADFFIINAEEKNVVKNKQYSLGTNNPFEGKELKGSVKLVVKKDKLVSYE